MNIRQLDQVVAIFLMGFGGYLIWAGLGYGFMQGTTPGAGYFPALLGGILIVLSMVNLLRNLGGIEQLKPSMTRREVVQFTSISVAMLVFVAITPWIGMTMATMFLMAAAALIIRPSLDRSFLLRVGVSAIFIPLICKLLFGTLLRVPIPEGVFGF